MFDFGILGPDFLVRLLLTLTALFLLVHFGVSRKNIYNDSVFIYYMFGLGVFIVIYALRSVEISFGFAFGLFAIFSMLRYRTEVLSFREMTYLFLVIVIALLCAVSPLSIIELFMLLAIITITAALLESPLTAQKYALQTLRYEKILNIKPENSEALLADLRQRTGLEIVSVRIISLDFMQDTAHIEITYKISPSGLNAKDATAHSLEIPH